MKIELPCFPYKYLFAFCVVPTVKKVNTVIDTPFLYTSLHALSEIYINRKSACHHGSRNGKQSEDQRRRKHTGPDIAGLTVQERADANTGAHHEREAQGIVDSRLPAARQEADAGTADQTHAVVAEHNGHQWHGGQKDIVHDVAGGITDLASGIGEAADRCDIDVNH